MAFPKAIITKPYLISNAEYQQLGDNIALVGYDSFSQVTEGKRQYASPRLLNWVEPVSVSGVNKTLFYTEVNSSISAGDKVYIINGNYDSDAKLKKDKYKKGSDGYSVLRVDGCKITLDIDYTGVLPYKEDSTDDYIKVYYIDSEENFVAANRQMTTRGGKIDYKFNYGQNNIAFIQNNYGPIEEWGRNGGVAGAPGFFVRESNSFATQSGVSVSIKERWNDISDNLVYLGSFSVALSSSYKNNGKILIVNGSFEYRGFEFREGIAYSWNATASKWESDPAYSAPIISRSNFRGGNFDGKFSSGVYGSLDQKLEWTGEGTWEGGTLLNSKWMQGTMNSNIALPQSLIAQKDQYGIPLQKPNTSNNGGYGYNFIIGSDIEKSKIVNGNFYGAKFAGDGTFSVVEDHILSLTQSYDSEVEKAFFHTCEFRNVLVKGGEVNNARAHNSRFSNIKAVNSQFEKSVVKDSTYVGDAVIKILGYDEWNMSEYKSKTSGTYSYIGNTNSKIYKFYISKESFDRLKAGDVFYIKGLKIVAVPALMPDGKNRVYGNNLLNFFDGKFKLAAWTQYYDDGLSFNVVTGAGIAERSRGPKNNFYKRGFECTAFLSTPEENSYVISSYEEEYSTGGSTFSKYRTELFGTNANKGYSIDIVASRHDIFNKVNTLTSTSDSNAPIPRDFNYDSDVPAGKLALPSRIGDVIDISSAYVIDADFESGIMETSDWNSGYHINYANEVALSGPTSTGHYDISIDSEKDHLIIKAPYNSVGKERLDGTVNAGDIIFLNSVDYDNRGMAATVTILATGSSYSTTNPTSPASLVNTTVSGTTMSATGSAYLTEKGLATKARSGNGTGLTVDITALPIGAVISITYSAPISGGSYSMSFTSNVSTTTGPIDTSTFTLNILTDDATGTVTGITPAMNGGNNATYSVFGPPQTSGPSSGFANAVYATGPASSGESGLFLKYYTQANGAISSIDIQDPGYNYIPGQIFKVEGGNATFSISKVSFGEVISYSVSNPGEDYRIGDVLDILKPFDPNSKFEGTTASIAITAITASYHDTKGLRLDITADGSGGIVGMTVSNPGRQYFGGEIFTISGGNLDALVRIDSVTGSMVSLPDTYKVVESSNGTITIRDMATQSIVAGLTGGGVFYTAGGNNRWNYLSKAKIDRTKIKSGVFRRPYVTRSLIRDIDFDSTKYYIGSLSDTNYPMLKNTMFLDTLFRSTGNILSSALYMHSNFAGGSDIWNDGIIYRSVMSGMTFSKGTVNQVSWLDGTFNGGLFYASRSFNSNPSEIEKDYLSNTLFKYYMSGEVNFLTDPDYRICNARDAWYSGTFNGGTFYKSDWDSGEFNGGTFKYSNFYSGTINGGTIGAKGAAATSTKIYSAVVNNTTVDSGYLYAEDSGYYGTQSQLIEWNNGTFNSGVFGSKNDALLGTTESNTTYIASIGALPIKDFRIAIATATVTDTTPLTSFELDATITLKHTYIGDLVVNLMAPNGKIINLKKRYAGGANDNMLNSVFTTDEDAPSIDIWTSPYTGTFKMAADIGQGVYYTLSGIAVAAPLTPVSADLPPVKQYRSYAPSTKYDGDRYLVVATASDPTWTGTIQQETDRQTFAPFVGRIVEWNSTSASWILRPEDANKTGNRVYVSSTVENLVYVSPNWLKSYHSDTSDPYALLNTNKTATGVWRLLVMDDAGADAGFVDEFSITLKYKNSYVIKQYRNTAIWRDGQFNGGQFIDMAIWKNGRFNGGKFISSYGWTSSGNFLNDREVQEEYTWQDGEFNGGEFGTESKDANSTWYKGEFNGGIFKGRLWNDGVFSFGEFKGSSKLPAAGGRSLKSEAAQRFIEDFRTGKYYGAWRKGLVSEKKDEFIKDKNMFTKPERATKPTEKDKKASFRNVLWIGGIFDHQSGEIRNSVWLNGLFRRGRFESGSFNPYAIRFADTKEFIKDDSCIWENGTLVNSEFHYSKWMQGRFISGTAVGMIWKDGIANYMNAYNVFWEDGIWRNGNWHGSSFEYLGKMEDEFDKEILNRGIQWSGTSSCHIWNMFESDTDKTTLLAISNFDLTTGVAVADTFATNNEEDAGVAPPSFEQYSLDIAPNTIAKQSTSITFKFKVFKGAGGAGADIKKVGIVYTEDNNPNTAPEPGITSTVTTANNVTSVSADASQGTTKVEYSGSLSGNEVTATVTITGLSVSKYYNIKAYAANAGGMVTTATLKDVRTTLALTDVAQPTVGSITAPHPTAGTTFIEFSTTFKDPNNAATSTVEAGIVWSKTNTDPIVGGANVANSSANSSVTVTSGNDRLAKANIYYTNTGNHNAALEGNTTYHFKTWVKNAASPNPVYSAKYTFKTGKIAPAITAFTDPGSAAEPASLSMTFDNKGSATLIYGFIMWKNTLTINPSGLANAKLGAKLATAPDANGNISGVSNNFKYLQGTTTADGTQTTSLAIANLEPGDVYYVLGYVVDPATTTLVATYPASGANQFKAASTVPVVTTTAIALADIDPTTAKLNANVTSDGGESITKRGIVYKNSSGSYPDPASSTSTSEAANSGIFINSTNNTGSFIRQISATLVKGEEYTFKAFAINSKGTGYSDEKTFTTKAEISIAARTNAASGSGTAKAFALTATTTITNAGSSNITASGIKIYNSNGTTEITTALNDNTKYVVKAFITNDGGTYYSAAEEAYTMADVETQAPEDIDKDGFKAKVTINSTGSGQKGIALIQADGTTIIREDAATTTFTYNTLATGTKYYYSAYMDAAADSSPSGANTTGWNSNTSGASSRQRTYSHVAFSDKREVWTLADITGTIAYGTGAISMPAAIANAGGSTITEYGLIYSTNTITDPYSSYSERIKVENVNSTNASITATLSKTVALTGTIKMRAYVVNQGGAFYGTEQTFNL